MSFTEISNDLVRTLEIAQPLLEKLSDADTSAHPAPGKWSKKEILGHLIDSASNNHQRFTRAALAGELKFPQYEQDALVALENFQALRWPELLTFWLSYNRFLAHLIAALPADAVSVRCHIGRNPEVTLQWLAKDYVEHLKHHLNQLVPAQFSSEYSPVSQVAAGFVD